MFSRKYRLKLVVLVSAIALFSFLITLCAAPVLAQDRVFLDLSLDYLGEYQLPKMNFLATPVGGLSAITYDKRRARFYALSDDQSEFAPARFYTLKITLNSSETAKIGIQKVDVESVTFLTDKDGQTYPKGTIAPKGIALTPQQTVFISGSVAHDKIAPFIQEFDINTGQMRASLPIPERYLPNAADELESTRGVTQTSAFVSLTFNPTGTIPASGEPIRLFTATESALVQDRDLPGSEQGTKCRFLHYLIGYGGPFLISEYFYPLEPTPDGVMSNDLEELIAVDQAGHFLSLERSTDQLGFSERIFQMATGGATDTSRIASLKGSLNGIRPIQKKLLLDLNELGIPLDNLQGMTLGPRLSDGTQSLILVSNDNFDDKQVTRLLLFRLTKPKTKVTAPLRLSVDQ